MKFVQPSASSTVSTLKIADADFLNERNDFLLDSGNETAWIVNQGSLNVSKEGVEIIIEILL